MNSNLIHEGETYAYYRQRPKGSTPTGAAKVRILSVTKRKSRYEGPNARTTITAVIVEEGSYKWPEKVGKTITAPARDILDYWDSYKDEEAVLLQEQAEREYERKRRITKNQVTEQMLSRKLNEHGLPMGTITVGDILVTMPLEAVKAWLGVSDDEIDRAVEYAVGPRPESSTPGYATRPYS